MQSIREIRLADRQERPTGLRGRTIAKWSLVQRHRRVNTPLIKAYTRVTKKLWYLYTCIYLYRSLYLQYLCIYIYICIYIHIYIIYLFIFTVYVYIYLCIYMHYMYVHLYNICIYMECWFKLINNGSANLFNSLTAIV